MYQFKTVRLLAAEHVVVLEVQVTFEGAGSGNQRKIYQIIVVI